MPSFSHDGQWIYFGNDRTGRQEIYRVPFRRGAAAQLTHLGGATPQESWDGKTVYYLKDPLSPTLCEAPVAGGYERPLGIDVVWRAFQVMADGIYFISPAGKSSGDFIPPLGQDSGRGEVRFCDFPSHGSRLIQAPGDANTFLGLSVSPDRNTFLYSVRQDNGSNPMLMENFR